MHIRKNALSPKTSSSRGRWTGHLKERMRGWFSSCCLALFSLQYSAQRLCSIYTIYCSVCFVLFNWRRRDGVISSAGWLAFDATKCCQYVTQIIPFFASQSRTRTQFPPLRHSACKCIYPRRINIPPAPAAVVVHPICMLFWFSSSSSSFFPLVLRRRKTPFAQQPVQQHTEMFRARCTVLLPPPPKKQQQHKSPHVHKCIYMYI